MALATFGAGCFWGVEVAFRQTRGVRATAVGYAGGHVELPSYEEVCGGRTGHAEAVQVEYDPELVSYADLLAVFWNCHDPTQLNRQGPDIGTQYRSVIFTHNENQAREAESSLEKEAGSGRHARPIVTKVVPYTNFYRAEEYHQQYLEKRGLATCRLPG